MQKTTHKASILIWSVFMSVIISIAFISISTKINKEIKNHGNILDSLLSENQISNIIHTGLFTHSFKNTTLENGDVIKFSSDKTLSYGLKKNETLRLSFSKNSNISLKMGDIGALSIDISGTTTQSGIITTSKNISNVMGNFQITNLGGYSLITLVSDTPFTSPSNTYQIVKQLGNTQLIKETGEIKNF